MVVFQGDILRELVIYIPQLILAAVFIGLAILVLKRNRTRLHLTLSGFYVLTALGLINNAIFLFATNIEPVNPLFLTALYYVGTSFPLIYALAFLVMFIVSLLRVEFTMKKQLVLLAIYGMVDILLYFYPEGITLVETEGWRPLYSWQLLITLYIYFTATISIPTVYYSLKLMKGFKEKNLRSRLRFFLIGIYMILFSFYGAILYNTWHEPLFRTIWSLMTFILLTISSILIYYGIGQQL